MIIYTITVWRYLMKKKTTAVLAIITFVMVLVFSSCSSNPNDKITVATIDGEKVTKTEYLETWESVKSNYGITAEVLNDAQYTDQLDDLRKDVLKSVVTQIVSRKELKELGYYQFTEEEKLSINEQTDIILQNILSSKEAEMMAELGENYNERDYAKAVAKYTKVALDEYGLDEDYIRSYLEYNIAMENAEIELLDVTVTNDDLLELFNQRVEEDQEVFSDLATYEYYTTQGGYEPYYVPEGFRMVRHVLISLDNETSNEIQTIRSAGNDEEADKLLETSLENIYNDALDIYALIANGEITFDEAIEQYNDDPGMLSSPNGYQMSLDSVTYVQEFTDAGMALENVGDISELVATDFGYHILEYTSDVESGPIDFDTVKNDLVEEATEIVKQEEWTALSEEWLAKYVIEYFYENLVEEVEPA